MSLIREYDLIVIGGGAAGFFAAIQAKRNHPEFRIAILEKNSKVLQKVLVSGGGRCNVTHACFDTKKLIENYPRGGKELLSVFKQFNPSDTVNWFQREGLALVAEADGRMFPITNQSSSVIACFQKLVEDLKIEVLLRMPVLSIHQNNDATFQVSGDDFRFSCSKLIVTTGGAAKKDAYHFLSSLSIQLKAPIPSLFTFNIPNHPLVDLMGVTVPSAEVRIPELKLSQQGSLLITHWGFSGPCIIKLSAFAAEKLFHLNYRYSVSISWIGTRNTDAIIQQLTDFKQSNSAKNIENAIPLQLPKRLWNYFIQVLEEEPQKKWSDISLKFIRRLSEKLCNDMYQAQGKTTFKEEFVTCGGVVLSDVNMQTMEHKRVKNLFFAGEVLDVDGVTGGFNFQAAWSTAFVAAK
jgi:predicted Rossmann fold flavoprotein